MRENLLGRLCMLEDLTSDSSNVAALQRITTRLTTLNRSPPLPQALTMTSYAISLDALPSSSLDSYSDELLVRISRMSIGDAVNVYRDFIPRAQSAIASLRSSSDSQRAHSHSLTLISLYHNFFSLWTMNQNQAGLFAINLETGQEEEPSDAWYKGRAMEMPVNAEFADLCITVQSFISHLSQDPARKPLTSIKEVSEAVKTFTASSSSGCSFTTDPENEETMKRQADLDAVLCRFESISRSMLSLRSLLTLYMTSQMIHVLGSEVCASFGRSVWPFAIPRGMKIIEFYLQRPDVQAALSEFRSSCLISTTLASLHGANANAFTQQPTDGHQVQSGDDINHDPFAFPLIEEVNPFEVSRNVAAANPESLELLRALTRCSSDEVSHKSSSPDEIEPEDDLLNPVESILDMLSNDGGADRSAHVISPRPLSEPALGSSSPAAHRPLMVQSDLPIEDMLLMASNHAWGS